VQEQFAGRVEIIGIGGSSTSVPDLERFVASYGASGLTHVSDTDNSVWERYGVTSQQTFVFINDDGSAESGKVDTAFLGDRVEQLLAT